MIVTTSVVATFPAFAQNRATTFRSAGAVATTFVSATSGARVLALTNGRWFTTTGRAPAFRNATYYVVGGRLTTRRPTRIDSTIDLGGRYVVPPFGDAHNHNLEQPFQLGMSRVYLRDGIYYVKNPNCVARLARQMRPQLNQPTTVDIVYSNAGLTATGGHPAKLYMGLRQFYGRNWTVDSLENRAFFAVNTEAELARKWPLVLAERPDFIKTYLLHSEEFARRRDDTTFFGQKGLDPALLPSIVQRAHAAGLRVSTHVETAADFHNALVAGVDEINHLPGYYVRPDEPIERYQIREADARLAGRRGLTVVTTARLAQLISLERRRDTANYVRVRQNQVRNLQLLHRHGVRLAIGADTFGTTSLPEAQYLHGIGAFDNATLLRIWCETTARAIFPNRNIGQLRDGAEASLLVLEGDPIADFRNVTRIYLRLKQGHLLPDA